MICRAIGPLRYLKSQAIIAWNRRAPMDPERTEFARILAGLKSRGVITQADIDRVSLPSSVLCPPSSPSPEAPHA